MSGQLTENHKHVRRRLEPLRMEAGQTAVRHHGAATEGSRVRVSVVAAFGVEYRGATLEDSGMDWSCGGKKPYLANRFVEEVVRLSQLRHPNLVALYGVVTDGPSLTLATDLPAASLDECLRRYESLPEFVKVSVLLDAARGLLYLHGQKPAVAHTRVSTRSVYVSPSMSAKIGDVGVAGALSEPAANISSGRMPPAAFVKILETGTKCADVQVDVPAFGNVVVHTACQQPWLDPPGHTGLSPHLHTMSTSRHPLYSLAYHCLLGGVRLSSQQQVPRVGMDYAVQFLQRAASNNPPPFPNTLELYWSLVEARRSSVELRNRPSSQPRENGVLASHQMNGGDIPLPGSGHKICNGLGSCSDQSSSAPTSSASRSLFPVATPSISTTKSTSNTLHPLPTSDRAYNGVHSVTLPAPSDENSRQNSTGQLKAPPPKPPQRTSSFRRKSSEKVEPKESSLQRAGSLRVKSQSLVEAPQQASPVIKTTGAGAGTKQNSLLLPSKFSNEAKLQFARSQQPEQHTSTSGPVSAQPPQPPLPSTANRPPSNGLAEFEILLARRREKVEADTVTKAQGNSCSLSSSNSLVIPHQNFLTPEGTRAATDMDLPKKKAPPPPRRSSSFRSRKKYEGRSDHHPPEVVLRRHNAAPHWPTGSSMQKSSLSPPSTSPSTGQCRPSSAEYHLRRLSGADLSETVFS